ncbi:hypothetical protein NDU88_001494 [Pleurodeles waltl]|uniref:Uncharacterized protein n=1 Tax=Pleurodeles waltl TaxID=8319 RepID=A0AAV7U8K2_PLEWA|nr:hypothetical protein NDU88_001494 [Pleurodeles waltl]
MRGLLTSLQQAKRALPHLRGAEMYPDADRCAPKTLEPKLGERYHPSVEAFPSVSLGHCTYALYGFPLIRFCFVQVKQTVHAVVKS